MPWTQLSPATSPSPRYWFGWAYDRFRDYGVLFGGYDDDASHLKMNDTWIWDSSNWAEVFPSTIPIESGTTAETHDATKAEHPKLAYDAESQQVMLSYFDNSPYAFRTYLWDGTDWNLQSPATSPPGTTFPVLPTTYGAGISEAPGIGNVIMFGGIGGAGGADVNGNNETWSWSGGTWTQLSPATTPPKRFRPFMTYDSVRQVVVMYGGRHSGTGERNDTWEWDGSDWTEVTTTILSAYSGNGRSFAFHEVCEVGIRFGGEISNSVELTWQWDGTDWTGSDPSPAPLPSIDNRGQSLIYDVSLNHIVHFGGRDHLSPFAAQDETWVWSCAPRLVGRGVFLLTEKHLVHATPPHLKV